MNNSSFKGWVIAAALILSPAASIAEPFSEPASLRGKSPAESVGYLRIPNLWGFFSAPKGNVLNDALANPQHEKILRDIQQSLTKNVITQAEEIAGPLPRLFLQHMRSPLEVMFLVPKDSPVPIPNGLLSMKLDFASIADLNKQLATLSEQFPQLGVVNEIGDDGYGVVSVGMPMMVHYDPDTGLFRMMAGMAVSMDLFQQTLEQLENTQSHPMYAMENQVDSSHQGLFAWIAVDKLKPLFQAGIPPETAQMLQQLGLMDTRSVALGWGTSEEKGRLKLLVDAPKSGYRELFPDTNNQFNLSASGEPRAVVSVSFPLLDLLKGFESIMRDQELTEEIAKFEEGKQMFEQEVGIPLEEALEFIGPEVIYFSDSVGSFGAMRSSNATQLMDALKKVIARYELDYSTRTIKGTEYHHLVIPSFEMPPEVLESSEPPAALFLEFYSRIGSHAYWTVENDYLIFASVPQLLMDRAAHTDRVNIAQWLKETQKLDANASLMMASAQIKDIPQLFYYGYLQSLNALGDLAQTKVDIFSLPSAKTLNLPEYGSWSIKLDASGPQLALEFSFENNPLEVALGGGGTMTTVAVVGILAAIAIPAYEDYIDRAQTSAIEQAEEGIELAEEIQEIATEHYLAEGKPLSSLEEVGRSSEEFSGDYVSEIVMDGGSIYIMYNEDADISIADEQLVLVPYETSDGDIWWNCGTEPVPEGAELLGTKTGNPVEWGQYTIEESSLPEYCMP